jgi:hypothetical protein
MPITWTVEPGGRFVLLSIADPYTFDEWREAMTAIFTAPIFRSRMSLLVDRRDTQSLAKATVEQMNRFFAEHQQTMVGGRCAILLSTGVDFEFARMLRSVLRIPNTSVRTFHSYTEAVDWLTK